MKFLKRKEWLLYSILSVILIVQVFLSINLAGWIGNLVNAAGGGTSESFNKTNIIKYSLILISAVCGISFIAIASNYLSNHISCKFSYYIRNKCYSSMNKLSLKQINEIGIGSIIQRTTNELDSLQGNVSLVLINLITGPGTIIYGIINMSLKHTDVTSSTIRTPWIFPTLTAGVIVFMLLIVGLFAFIIIPNQKKSSYFNDKLCQETHKTLIGIKTIKSFNAWDFHINRFNTSNEQLKHVNYRLCLLNSIASPALSFFMSLLTASIYIIGGILIRYFNHLELTYSDLLRYATLSSMIVNAFLGVITFFLAYPLTVWYAKRIKQIIYAKEEIVEGKINVLDEKNELSLEIKNLSFRYANNSEYVLKDISFSAKSGQLIGIVGPTGSGKSTLINIIPRFLDPTNGSIKVYGIETKDLTFDLLRSKIAYIPQRVSLLNTSIANNIGYKFLDPTANMVKITDASKIAIADEFINKYEDKYSHIVSNDRISGGQRQRLAIASAIANKPDILLLDDSFSALDYTTDLNLRNNIQKKLKKSIKIVVASRIATIINADHILVIDNGKIIAQGKHDELLSTSKFYRDVYNIQTSEKYERK